MPKVITFLLYFILFSFNSSDAQIKRSKLNLFITTTKSKLEKPGLVVGSIAIVKSKSIEDHHYLRFSKNTAPQEKKDITTLEIITGTKKARESLFPDLWAGDTAVYIFAYRRSEGAYMLDRASYYTVPVTYIITKIPGKGTDLAIDLPFIIKEGMVTYIGQTIIDTNKDKAKVVDRSGRDLNLISERFGDEGWDFSKVMNSLSK